MKQKVLIICTVCIAAVMVMLHYFPVYRLIDIATMSYHSNDELRMLVYIGSRNERDMARPVMDMAEAAFSDIDNTGDENAEEYGLLGRYAVDAARNAAREEHELKMLSAHFDDDIGYIWVKYSQEAFDAEGNTVCGSREILSLWQVAKDGSGEWRVVHIKEHP